MQERRKMNRRDADNGWQEYQKLVLNTLEELKAGQKETNEKIDGVKEQIHKTPCPTAIRLKANVESNEERIEERVVAVEKSTERSLSQIKWLLGIFIGTMVAAVVKLLFG